MAVAPTYPGVYIEEIPSGVHTITGVATSITAFVGYTARGSVDSAIHLFSYADFERAFGGLSSDSPTSYCVKQFFQNGGTDAYVVRVANGATSADVTMRDATAPVLVATAAGQGTWGNNLELDVDYATANPSSMFNLGVTEFVNQGGQMVPGRRELFRNLTLNAFDASYALTVVNASSALITLALAAGLNVTGSGTSTSGTISAGDVTALTTLGGTTPLRLGFVLNGSGPFEITIPTPAGAFPGVLTSIAADIRAAINTLVGGGSVTESVAGQAITITSGDTTSKSAIHFLNASAGNAAALLHLGLANGGVEVDGAAGFRPMPTGTTGTVTLPLTGNTGTITIDVKRGTSGTSLRTIALPIWATAADRPATLDELAQRIGNAMAAAVTATPPEPYLAGATARRVGDTIQVVPGPADPNLSFDFGATTPAGLLTALGLNAANARNIARYAPGVGLSAFAQVAGTVGNNGTPPLAANLQGSQAAKTGLYALENVDLFNLLVMPDATEGSGMTAVLAEAIAYCVRRRAFMIIDVPESVSAFAQAQTWIGSSASTLRSRNSALYFPRIREPDPLLNNVVGSFPAAGALAGLYARTDAERGVWKAPAGTTATISGATGLSYTLTDAENGTLNPLGLNCLRTFPIYGTVSWGARTGNGADAMADEYKYIPVRRLALFLEESLYRGTQWVVFEPNDEPLWAQIRLNLGAFMHTLFAQGAFQGRTPREAYFVKCDKETTTQNDIDLGRVNIVVGFAPLKPAEFVIIRIQQIVRDLQV